MAELVYHGDHPARSYAFTDSSAGIAEAAVLGFPAADLNIRTCRANNWRLWRRHRRIVVVHWSRWWEHGFKAKPGTHVPHKPIERLRLEQVRNLVSVDGHHEILTAEEAVDECARRGVFPFFEMKPSRWLAVVLRRLGDYAAGHGLPLVFTTIQTYGDTARAKARWERKAYDRMQLAHISGQKTCLLYRRPLSWEHWAPVLTGIKGHRGRHGVLDLGDLIHLLKKETR